MLPNFSRTELSEYGFLKLLMSTMMLQGYSPILDNVQLERQLYKFRNDNQYKFLFQNICWESSKVNGDSRIILDDAFQFAYAIGLLVFLPGDRNARSVINVSLEEARVNLSSFDEKQVAAMDSLCTKMKEKSTTTRGAKIYVITKKENDL